MKAAALILLFFFCSIESRKIVPINKNANIDFINMEAGGVRVQPAVQPQPKQPAQAPAAPAPAPAPAAPAPTTPAPTTKAPAPAVKPAVPQPQKPAQPAPTQIKPVPVNPQPVANPITTPGPGSVKSLVNFYDAQGKASLIRPYSYSQAVKQG